MRELGETRLDRDMDERVRAWLCDTALPPAEARRGLERVLSEIRTMPQARPGIMARWRSRDGGIPRRRIALSRWLSATVLGRGPWSARRWASRHVLPRRSLASGSGRQR